MCNEKICFKITVKGDIITYVLDGVTEGLYSVTYNKEQGIPLSVFASESNDDYKLAEAVWSNQYLIWRNMLQEFITKSDNSEIYEKGLVELENLSFNDVDTSVERL